MTQPTQPQAAGPRPAWAMAAVLVAGLLAACSPAPPGTEIWDPFEAENRERHTVNLELDAATTGRDGGGLPAPVSRGIANFAANAGGPSDMLNHALQARPGRVVESTFRFLLNSTLGIGGLFDVATAIGVEGRRTDFGETLHVWGAPEGAYLVLPLIGPSTERDTAGAVVDLLIDPLNALRPGLRGPAVGARTTARALARIGDRAAYSDAIDALVTESADSYAQARLLFLQSRRFQLDGVAAIDAFDPFEDPYLD